MTAAEVKAALRRHYHGQGDGMGVPAWICIDEAFSGWASAGGGIDLLAIGAWRTAKSPALADSGRRISDALDTRNPIVAHEVKVSRSDMRRELYGYTPGPNAKARWRSVAPWPGKAQHAIARCHYFVFAVPEGLLLDDEVRRRVPWGVPERGQMTLDDVAPRRGALYVPEGCGLVEVTPQGVRVRVRAKPREPRPWTRHETHELLRRAACAVSDVVSR